MITMAQIDEERDEIRMRMDAVRCQHAQGRGCDTCDMLRREIEVRRRRVEQMLAQYHAERDTARDLAQLAAAVPAAPAPPMVPLGGDLFARAEVFATRDVTLDGPSAGAGVWIEHATFTVPYLGGDQHLMSRGVEVPTGRYRAVFALVRIP